MTELQKEYCEEKGLIYIKPENTEISDYVNWLETQIQALRIHDVVGRSEHLICPYCKGKNIEIRHREQSFRCIDCKEGWAN